MKQNRIIGIVFTAINCILIVICAVFYFRTDKAAPKFEVQAAEVVYISGMDQSELLTGITAFDKADGDVTNRIVIEKIIENSREQTVVVFFAVSDEAGNVAKFSKEFPAKLGEKKTEVQEVQEASAFGTAGFVMALEPTPEPMPEPTAEPFPEPTPEPTPTPTPTPAPSPTPVREEAPPPTPKPDEGAPVLTLKVTEVKTTVGIRPAWVEVIQILKDDKDNYETLFNNITVSKYDINKAGTYGVTLTTEDSDGNKSQAVPLTIIVQ